MKIAGLGLWMALAVLPGWAAAQTQVQKCVISSGSKATSNGIISNEYYFLQDAKTGAVQVEDSILQYFTKKPADAVVSANDGATLAFSWSVLMVNSAGQRTKMLYRATLFKTTNEIDIFARPNGYKNTFQARGKCAPFVPN